MWIAVSARVWLARLRSRLAFVLALAVGLGALEWAVASRARADAAERVVVAPIDGMIDLGLGPFVERVLEEANELGALGVVLEINTLGGRVDAAIAIRDHLLGSELPTVAFVNPRAISAGALITLAAEAVVVARGATIGAATPVMLGQPGEPAQPVEEKTVSYVRKEFRATADARGRPGEIAEAMVDADVEIEGVVAKGKLLTLTTDDALLHEVADFVASDLGEVLSEMGWGGAEIVRLEMNWAERTVRFLTHPVLASILMTLGLLGLVIELRTPGLGVPGLVGVLSLAAFFWGHTLVELVGWEQLLLVVVGLALLALEVFVIPGFGVVGVAGIIALAWGLTTSLTGAGATISAVVMALGRVMLSVLVALLASLVALRFLPRLPAGKQLVLGTALPEGAGIRAAAPEGTVASLLGAQGTTLTPLRPAGLATIAGRRVDVVSQGEFINAGQLVEVIRDEGNRVVVKSHEASQVKGGSA